MNLEKTSPTGKIIAGVIAFIVIASLLSSCNKQPQTVTVPQAQPQVVYQQPVQQQEPVYQEPAPVVVQQDSGAGDMAVGMMLGSMMNNNHGHHTTVVKKYYNRTPKRSYSSYRPSSRSYSRSFGSSSRSYRSFRRR